MRIPQDRRTQRRDVGDAMKRLTLLFVVNFLCNAAVMGHACSDVAGTWGVSPPPADGIYYVCTQTAVGGFTCAVTLENEDNTACHMSYSGTGFNDSTGYNTYDATYVSGSCAHWHTPASWSASLSMGGAACNLISDGAEVFVGDTGWIAQRSAIEIPGTSGNGGENPSVWDGWQTGNGGSGQFNGSWHATLKDLSDTNYNFGGRSTSEGAPHITSNTCLPANDPSPNDVWTPGYNNNYSVGDPGDDGVGFPGIANIIVIQKHYKVVLPCTITIQQIMSINCATGWCPYETHNLLITTGDGTFTVSRNGDSHMKAAGATRKVWRWMDLNLLGITR